MAGDKVKPDEEKKPEEPPKILAQPLPRILEEMDENVRKAAEAAVKAAVEEATMKIEEAKRAVEEVARQAKQAAEMADAAAKRADEAFVKASDALSAELVRRVLRSRQFLLILIFFFLASVFAAISIGLGLSLMAQ